MQSPDRYLGEQSSSQPFSIVKYIENGWCLQGGILIPVKKTISSGLAVNAKTCIFSMSRQICAEAQQTLYLYLCFHD